MTISKQRETLLEFPCDFPIKVMGKEFEQMRNTLMKAVARHAPGSPRHQVSRRDSRKGNYVGLTITITATSQLQLDNIYRELSASEHIMVTL